MSFTNQIVFFFGAIGAFNSLLISFYYLFLYKSKNLSIKIFSAFLFILGLRVLKSLFYSFSTSEPIFILQSGPAFFLLIGPLLYSYVLSYRNTSKKDVKWIKLTIGFWTVTVLFISYFIPFSSNVVVNKTILLPLINLQMLIYILASTWKLKSYAFEAKAITLTDKWLLALILSTLALWSIFTFIDFEYVAFGSVVYSLIFYSFFLYLHRNKAVKLGLTHRVVGTELTETTDKRFEQKLVSSLVDDQLFTSPDLKLPDLAQRMGVSVHALSGFLNDRLNVTFRDFINQYRVDEAKRLLREESVYTVEAIGNLAGFKSKSAFYNAFKKFTGTSPAKYQDWGR